MTLRYTFLLLTFLHFSAYSQTDSSRLQWFNDAKLGIFIHWGMYAVDGTSESWAFHNRAVPYADYMRQKNRFTAKNYDPEAWAKLIKESGARYAVLTTQHHDGLALWDTKQLTPTPDKTIWSKAFPDVPFPKGKTDLWNTKVPLSTVYQTPAKRDVITPFVAALEKENIRFGAYYSLLNWSHNNYPTFLKDYNRYDIAQNPQRWAEFLKYMHAQITEINSQFKPDLYWFDGDWERSEEEWNAAKIDSIIHTSNPDAILNGRLKSYGDYSTPEQNQPVIHPEKSSWELCLTSNDNWGYRPKDQNWKTTNEVLQIFTECLNMGGNLLLDIGPKEDGTIPEQQVKLLKEIGRWTSKHSEAIFGSIAGLPYGHYAGNSTLSKDSTTLYLFVNQVHSEGKPSGISVNLQVKGLKNQITKAEVLGTGTTLTPKIVGKISWSYVPGTVFLDIPATSLDEEITVIKLTLDKPLDLYRGQGGFH